MHFVYITLVRWYCHPLDEENMTKSSAYKREDIFLSSFSGLRLFLSRHLTIPLIKKLKIRTKQQNMDLSMLDRDAITEKKKE